MCNTKGIAADSLSTLSSIRTQSPDLRGGLYHSVDPLWTCNYPRSESVWISNETMWDRRQPACVVDCGLCCCWWSRATSTEGKPVKPLTACSVNQKKQAFQFMNIINTQSNLVIDGRTLLSHRMLDYVSRVFVLVLQPTERLQANSPPHLLIILFL